MRRRWCPFRLTDIPVSLTFNPSESDSLSFILLSLTVPQEEGGGKNERLEANGSKELLEGCITHEDRVSREVFHPRTIRKDTG